MVVLLHNKTSELPSDNKNLARTEKKKTKQPTEPVESLLSAALSAVSEETSER